MILSCVRVCMRERACVHRDGVDNVLQADRPRCLKEAAHKPSLSLPLPLPLLPLLLIFVFCCFSCTAKCSRPSHEYNSNAAHRRTAGPHIVARNVNVRGSRLIQDARTRIVLVARTTLVKKYTQKKKGYIFITFIYIYVRCVAFGADRWRAKKNSSDVTLKSAPFRSTPRTYFTIEDIRGDGG